MKTILNKIYKHGLVSVIILMAVCCIPMDALAETSEDTLIELVPDQQVTASINFEGDTEWFKINVDQTCSIISEITNNSGYIHYDLYDASLNNIYHTYLTSSRKFGWKVKPGTYYIKLSEYSGVNYAASNISLKVSLREEDPYENNDISSRAVEIAPGQELTNISIEASNDTDWFKIKVEQPCSIISEITNNSGRIIYGLYDTAFNNLYHEGFSSSRTFGWKVKPGTYYIKISEDFGINYLDSDISLKVSLREDDPHENNDIRGRAYEIVLGQELKDISIEAHNDVDWFKINVEQPCSIISEITNNSGWIKYELYDASLNNIVNEDLTSSGRFGWKVKPGVYYIKLSEAFWTNYLDSNISLKVSLREEDPYENNDIAGRAYEIVPGQELTGISIEAKNDTDWFKINVDQTGSIISEITNNSGWIKYELYDASLNNIFNESLHSSGKFECKVKPGIYYIKLSEASLDSDISLKVNITDSQIELPEPIQEIVPEQQVETGITHEGDTKWFKVNVDQRSSIISEINNNSGYINYDLYDAALNNIYHTYSGSFGKLGWKVEPGTYYIKLSERYGVNYTDSNISLKVSLLEEDQYENNDLCSDAVEIKSGQELTEIKIEARNDADWFKINVDQSCSIISEITSNSGFINFNLYDDSLNNLYHTYLGGKVGWKVKPGTYYIKLSEEQDVNYTDSNISLKVSLLEEDEWENNDLCSDAVEIKSGQELTGIKIEARNDADWFKINVDQSCSIIGEITSNSGFINYDLYDDSLNNLYHTYLGGKVGWKVKPGTYYIKLSEKQGVNYTDSNISLKVSLGEEDQYENNDLPSDAVEITSGQELTGIKIKAKNDAEWFKINVDQTSSIISEITSEEGSIRYELYDAAFNRIYKEDYITSKTLSYMVAPGEYYIKISENGINYTDHNMSFKVYLKDDYNALISLVKQIWCELVGEPINVVNGNFFSESEDINIPTNSIPLKFKRTYNSCSKDHGPLGKGWHHNYHSYLSLNPDHSIGITHDDGHSSVFTLESGGYTAQFGSNDTLTHKEDGTYELTYKNQLKYTYNDKGQLIKIKDKNNNTTTLEYTNALLSTVTEPTGRSLTFTYNENNQLTKVTDPANETVAFTYDEKGNLITSKDLKGAITTYTYDDYGMTTMLDPENQYVIKNTYDSESRVIEQEDGKGQKLTITYDPVHRKNAQTDGNGNTTIYHYDEQYKVTKIEYPDGTTTLTTYDENYNKTSITDQNGHTTTYTYDTKGNMLTKTEPSPLNYITTYTYDNLNNPTTITDAKGSITNFIYDTKGNLITTTKEVKGEIIKNAFHYNELGQMISTTNAKEKITQMNYDTYGNLASLTDPKNHTTTYTYDIVGRKLTQTDALNNTWIYTYDPVGNLLTQTDPLGNITTNTYNLNDSLLSTTDPLGNTTTYAYDENERLTKTTDAKNNTHTFDYDANGNQITITDPNGNTTTKTYDALNRLIAITDPLNNTENYTLDGNGNIITKTDKNQNTTHYTYDARNHLIKTTDALNQETTLQYDELGNKIKETNAKNNALTYTYDENSRLITVTDPQGNTTAYTYDLEGNKTSMTNAKGKTWTYTYDDLNRLTTTKDPLGAIYAIKYDAIGNKVSETDERNNTTTYTYDANSRQLTLMDALGNTTAYTYDAAGNIMTTTNAKGKTWTYTYDTLNQLIKTTDPLGNITQTEYDNLGNTASTTDANNNTTHYTYNPLGQYISVIGALGNTTTYHYDSNGNLTKITDAKGKTKTIEYDALNRTKKKTDALGNTDLFAYDSVGNIMTRTKADGTEITYTYDENNRLTKVGYPDASEVTYTYDALGARIKMQDKNGETTYTYTDLNQLKTVVRSGSAITYDYDTAGNLTTIKYPDGMQLKYTYNPVNLPIFVLDGTNTLEITYDETNKRLIENLPNGIKVQYDYDESGRLKKLQHEAEGNIIAKTEYTLDNIGNRINIVDKENQSNTYTYDKLNQLTQVDEANGNTVQYTYDPVGNRQKMNGEIKEDNLLLKENVTYEYDYEDRLIGYEDGTNTITYTYDGDGNLIGKTITGEINESKAYYYDYSVGLPRLLVEKNSNGDTNRYLYAGRLYSRVGAEGQVYYHQDGLGSTIAITDDTGQIQNEYQYDEFGNHTALQENIENNMLYTGELLDESGLYYLRARYYDPKVGRFITEDTLFGEINNPITQNLYIYVGNNPVLYIDPSGHKRCNISIMQHNYITNEIESLKNSTSYAVMQGKDYLFGVGEQLTGGIDEFIHFWSNRLDSASTLYAVEVQKIWYENGIYMDIETLKLTVEIPLADAAGQIVVKGLAGSTALSKVGKAGQWVDEAGNIKWPKNDGFAGSSENITLKPGTRIDRYGYEGGTFVSPEGIPYKMRSLAPGTEVKPYHVYEVVKPVEGLGGKIAPWFDQPGGGIQYKLNNTIQELLDGGFIREVVK